MIEFDIPGKSVSWNVFYSGKHWSKRKEIKDFWYTNTVSCFRERKFDFSKVKLPLYFEIISYKKIPLDPDNIASGKMIIDAIKKEIKIDDSYRNISSITFKSIRSSKEFIRVKIYDQDDEIRRDNKSK